MDYEKAKLRTDLDALTSSVNSALAALTARLADLDALAARVVILETPAPEPPPKRAFGLKPVVPKHVQEPAPTQV